MDRFLLSLFKISVLSTFVSCSLLSHSDSKSDCQEGIEGYVYHVSGNQMPSPDMKPASLKGVSTVLYIYDLTSLGQVQRQGQSTFYYTIDAKFVKKVETDSNGYFKTGLPPGKYSLFVKKDSLFYSNTFDQNNNISPVEVVPGKFSKVEFRVNYDAVY